MFHILINNFYFTESFNCRCQIIHNCCSKSGTRRWLRMPRILSELWHTVYEYAEYPFNTEEFSFCTNALCIRCGSTKV